MKNLTKSLESGQFLSFQIKNAQSTGIGASNTFKLVEKTPKSVLEYVDFTAPLPVPTPLVKKFIPQSDYADQKLAYKVKMAVVLRDRLVAALANAPSDEADEKIRSCVDGMLKLKLNFKALNWDMKPNVEGLSQDAAKKLDETYQQVAARALIGLRLEMGTHESATGGVSQHALTLFQLLEKGLRESISPVQVDAQQTQLPPPPTAFVMAIGTTSSPQSSSQPQPQPLPQPGQPQPQRSQQSRPELPENEPRLPHSTATKGTVTSTSTSTAVSRPPRRGMKSGYESDE